MSKAIIVTGSREWADYDAVVSAMKKLPKGTIVIHGEARGADYHADCAAQVLGMVTVRVPYLSRLGKAGGAVRNKNMGNILLGLKKIGYDVEVWAFHDNLPGSRGTKDMVIRAKKLGFKIRRFKHAK